MGLSAGDKLGPYEIVAPIGAGGMGEVYKARDTRLDRSVAIKVLPEHIAKREDLRARFEREARAVASLNHPHICTLHDIGSQDGTGFMVMEHLEGETLAARIDRGPIPLQQAIALASQIADALDRAHRAGVTHRDVKPGNIMLTRDGVKVLDFGLAKASTAIGPSDDTLTTAGTVVGTPRYMAPEQFEGKGVDARTDIWAFGAVLYEMVTGRKAFQGKSYSSLVNEILAADPAPMAVKPFTPVWLERLVRRCLAKDPEDRYQSMRDLVLDLHTPAPESVPGRPSRWPWAVAAACLVVAAALGWIAWRQRPAEPPFPVTLEVNLPEGSRVTFGSAISPDGRTLAFVALTGKGETLLHVRPLESLEVRALAGTESATYPFWSPDSKSLAFMAGGKLKRIDVAGGPPITLCDATFALGGTWSEDGVILFSALGAIQRISSSGGTPAPVTKPNQEAGERAHQYPKFLPGGQRFLYLVPHNDPENAGIFTRTLNGNGATKIVTAGHMAAYDSGSGRLLYIQGDGVLIARRLELNPPRLTGDPGLVAEGISIAPGGFANFSVSANGILFYGRERLRQVRLAWRDRAGKVLETIGQPFQSRGPFRISPDQSTVAYTAGAGAQMDIWMLDLARGVSRRFTSDNSYGPRWSADGKHLYYTSTIGTNRKSTDGSGDEESVIKGPSGWGNVSPDGKFLLYAANGDIWTLSLTGERKQENYLQTKHIESWGTFSPDGRWVAYQSEESGVSEIYVQGFPERRGRWQVSAGGGLLPEWRSDGKELYWLARTGRTLMAASIDLQAAAVRVGKPAPLFQVQAAVSPFFQPSPDGRRFLVQEPEGGAQPDPPMVVVQNWAARLGK